MLNQKIIYIDSGNTTLRKSGTTSNFLYDVQFGSDEVDRVAVLSANIPMSYYIVQAGEYFILEEKGVDVNVNIPEGNYSAVSFQTVVIPLINAASPHTWIYSVTMPNAFTSPATARYTFTVTGNLGSQPTFKFRDGHIYEQFGFVRGSDNVFSGSSLTSTCVVKFIAEDTLFIHSDICDNAGNDDVLQEIYNNNASQFSNVTFQNSAPEAYSKKIKTTNSSTFRFNLCDELGRNLDLHGLNMLITLLVYKKDDISSILRNYIKYSVKTN